jgi:hypothetical protein
VDIGADEHRTEGGGEFAVPVAGQRTGTERRGPHGRVAQAVYRLGGAIEETNKGGCGVHRAPARAGIPPFPPQPEVAAAEQARITLACRSLRSTH